MKILEKRPRARSHWPLALLATASFVLLFTNLEGDSLWADEGDTAVLGANVARFGIPKAWDGATFMDSDFGTRENDQLIMVSSPWVQYYAAAASFLILGQNTFSARLPFALAGWLTILLVYYLVWRVTADRRSAFCATAILVCSLQFLLLCRQCRYYALSMLLTCLLLWIFLGMKSASRCALFAIVAIVSFHTHPIGIVTVGTLGVLTLIFPPFVAQRRWFWLAFPAILVLTLPWLGLAPTGYTENAKLVPSLQDFFLRLGQYLIECASVTPLIGIALLVIALGIGKRFSLKNQRDVATGSEENTRRTLTTPFLFVLFAILLLNALTVATTQRTAALWVTGIRYTSAIIPLLAMAAGILIVSVSRGRAFVWGLLLAVFLITNFAQITPWLFWADTNPDPTNKLVAAHVPERIIDRFFATGDLLFLRDLWYSNPGTVSKGAEFLVQHAQRGDVVITNYESEPLYFYTRLPQGMKIMKQDRIYEAARSQELPDYVFGVDHARWIVWRFNWDQYLGINWADVQQHLLADGARIEEVATLEETGWENRENVHFHRFSGGRYLFRQDSDKPPARIFHVDWPD